MTPRSSKPSQIKYKLLDYNKSTSVKSIYLWTVVPLATLVTCFALIAFYTTWMNILNSSNETDDIDFLIFGPKRSSMGLSWISRQRGKQYGEAAMKIREDPDWDRLKIGDVLPHVEPPEYKRVCYYNLKKSGYFNILMPDMLSADLCTHINIAFATVIDGTIQPAIPSDIEGYTAITALKKVNPKLKVMLSVLWFTSEGEFAWVVSSEQNRTKFVDEAVKFLETYDLDGLDIDWEFPSWPTVVQNQTNSFMDLLQLLSTQFRTRTNPLILSVAVGAPKPIIDRSYNITAMAEYIDFVNVMAYDYHMYQDYLPLTGANAPLYQRQQEKGYFTTLNLNWTVTYWLYKGMPASKMVIGIPTYGHSYTLVNEDNHGWEAPSSGVGVWGIEGFITYGDACKFMNRPGVKSVFDYESKVPYAFKAKDWISFDNEQSVAYKAEFIKKYHFGGAMIFSLNSDDVESVCDGASKFPLTERVKNVLQDDQM